MKLKQVKPVERVLVTRFSALGDVAMTIPVLYAAARQWPDVQFTMVTRRGMEQIFVNAPANLQVVGVDLKKPQYQGLRGVWRLAGELIAQYHPDAYVDLHDVLRTRIIALRCRLSGIRVSRLDKGRRGKRALTRRRHKIVLPLPSSRARYRQAFFRIGLPVSGDGFSGLWANKADKADNLSLHSPISALHSIGIAPFAAHKGKIYPLDKMRKVVDTLAQRQDVKVLLFGAPGSEADTLKQWAQGHDNVEVVAGSGLGLRGELERMSSLSCMVAMDSANMHLASLAGTRVVSVWGATHPYCGFRPWHQRDTDTVSLPMTCRPCSSYGQRPCHRGDYLCMHGITPQMILNKIYRIIEPSNS